MTHNLCTVLLLLLPADALGLTAHDEYELAVRALGACTWYLKESYLDQQLLSLGRFELYQPRDLIHTTGPAVTVPKLSFSRHMASIGTQKHIIAQKLSCTEKPGYVVFHMYVVLLSTLLWNIPLGGSKITRKG
jgi:hypothetical protein